MLSGILISLAVLVVSVGIQVLAVIVMIRQIQRFREQGRLARGAWSDTLLLSTVMVMLFIGHLIQIAIWAWLFLILDEFADFATAFYHSAVNFASLGYGDLVMSERWRLLGAIEAGNGVLMFGLSAATMFAVLTWMIGQYEPEK